MHSVRGPLLDIGGPRLIPGTPVFRPGSLSEGPSLSHAGEARGLRLGAYLSERVNLGGWMDLIEGVDVMESMKLSAFERVGWMNDFDFEKKKNP